MNINIDRRVLIAFLVGFFFATILPHLLNFATKMKVGEKIKKLYELAYPGINLELVDVLDEGSMYKVILKAAPRNYIEVYTTKDGKFLSENVIFVKESIERIQRLKNFVDCLAANGVKIYGLNNNTATLLQLNLLGRYSSKLYVSCDGTNLQRCINAGITQVPSIFINGRVEPGVKTIDWFEKETNCTF